MAEGGLALAAVGLGRWLGAPPFATWRWSPAAAAAGLAATAPLLVGLWACLRSTAPSLRRLVRWVEHQLGPAVAACSPAQLLFIAALAGVGEEAFFRGFLQPALTGPLPQWAALAAASAAFGLAHAVTPAYAALAALVGLYLGALFLASGNLLAPAVTHAAYDLAALHYLARTVRARRSSA